MINKFNYWPEKKIKHRFCKFQPQPQTIYPQFEIERTKFKATTTLLYFHWKGSLLRSGERSNEEDTATTFTLHCSYLFARKRETEPGGSLWIYQFTQKIKPKIESEQLLIKHFTVRERKFNYLLCS